MALTSEDIKLRYPLPAYNYRVTVLWGSWQSIPAGTDLSEMLDAVNLISCTEVSGLSMEYDTVTYQHGYSFLTGMHIIPAMRKEVRFSIRKGLVRNGRYLSDWMNLSYPIIAPKPANLLRKRDILIDLCDKEGLPVVRWTVIKALPIKLDAPSFNAETNEIAFEKIDFIAHQLKVNYDP